MDKILDKIIKVLNSIPGNKMILDVGTKDGADSVQFVENITNSVSYAFEGDPRARVIPHEKIRYITKAVGNVNGKIKWYGSEVQDGIDGAGQKKTADKQYYGSSSLKKPKMHFEIHPHVVFNETEVECIRLDDWVEENNIPFVHLLWLDVNGGEREFLEGATKTLLDKTVFFITECFDAEIFEEQISVPEIQSILNNQFQIIEFSGNLVSFYNLKYINNKGEVQNMSEEIKKQNESVVQRPKIIGE